MSNRVSSSAGNLTTRFSRKNNIFYIRLTVIIVIAYMLLIESTSIDRSPWPYFYLAIYMGTNLFLSQLPNHYFHQKQFYYLLAAFDTCMIALGIFLVGQADSFLFVIYFLIIGISAMNRNIKYLMLNTLMFIIIYGWIMYISGQFHGEDAVRYALRLPFIWAFAILIGYIIECVIYDLNKSIGELEEKYRSLVQSIDSPIFMLDQEGRFIYVNEKMLSNFKTTEEQIQNKHFSNIFSAVEADLVEHNLDYVFGQKKSTQFVSFNQRQDQWFLNIFSPVKDFASDSIKAVSAVSKDITENVKSEHALRKAYENLKQAQDQLIQKNKLEALGRMASGIAHQIRNPLEIILFGVEFLEELGYRKDQLARQSIDKIKTATHRVNRIVHDVLQFSRNSSFILDAVNIHSLLKESIEFIEHKIAESNIQLEINCSDSNLLVFADRSTLQQVFLNILNNAIEAMENNGQLRIRTYTQDCSFVPSAVQTRTNQLPTASSNNRILSHRQGVSRLQQALNYNRESCGKLLLKQAKTDLDAARKNSQSTMARQDLSPSGKIIKSAWTTTDLIYKSSASQWVVVEIEDNGPGMSEEIASNIFEPFYTTKQAYNGTGLGLSIASLIIERHQGQIELKTNQGQGTVFKIKLLPAHKKEASNEGPEKDSISG